MANSRIRSIFVTFSAFFRQLILFICAMRWLINFLFKKKEIKTNRAVLVQKIILKKYLLR